MRTRVMFLVMVVLLFAVTPVFAQNGASDQSGMKTIGYVVGMGIAAGLCGIGQGRAAAGAAEAIARNPAAGAAIRLALILGLAFIESLAIYTLAVVYTK
jgi:F-type H+-transporting ATPase subunit c